jgi:hypothetical protein
MRLVALILLLLSPTFAHAAPVIVIVAAVAGTITVAQAVLMIGMMLYGTAQQKRAERRLRAQAAAERDAFNAALTDRTINAIGTESPHVYVYGRARTGSTYVAMFNSGSRDEYKHLVAVHAAHECDAIEEVYINGEPLALDVNGYTTSPRYIRTNTENALEEFFNTNTLVLAHTPITSSILVSAQIDDGQGGTPTVYPIYSISGDTITLELDPPAQYIKVNYQYYSYTPMVRVMRHLGTPDDPADATLLAEVPNKWAPTAVLRGLCYTVIRLNLNQPDFQGGIPQIEVLIRGKKLYNFRTGETAWSQNNAEVIWDYLTSEICGVPASDLPLDQFITAANVCDEGDSAFGPLYTFNGTVDSDMDKSATLERMAQSMAGGLVSTSWDIYAGKYTAPVMTLDQTDFVGNVSITPGLSDSDLYNGIRGQYVSEENNYVPTDFKAFQNPAYVEADGRELWTNIDFGFTNEVQRIWNIARIFTEDQRNAFTLKAEYSMKAWGLKVGQRILHSSTTFGWEDKVFRVTDKKFSPSSTVELTLKEDDPSIWDFADAVTPDSTPNTGLPNPFYVDPIASVSLQSGSDQLLAKDGTVISRILVTWPVAVSQAVFTRGIIEIEWQLFGSDIWDKVTANGDETQTFLSPVEDGSFYIVRVRAVNQYLNVKSDWTYAAPHQVIGKTEPPANVATFFVSNSIFTWTPNTELDLAGYVVRFQYGNNTSWADAAPMHTGVLTSSPWTPEIFPPGPITVMIKAVDTSGNESLMPAVIQYNFGDTILDNLVFTYDDKAAGFAGTATNGSVVTSGDLVANDSGGLFWGADLARFWGADSIEFWPTSTYLEMMYILAYEVMPDEVGARLTLDVSIIASSYTIEYRYGTQGVFWGMDADFYWGSDDVLFWPPATEWTTWPGALENIQSGIVEFRIVTQAGETQGQITEFTLNFDVVDEYEELDNIAVSPFGTVLPITKLYRSINNIQLTLQEDGGTAVTAKWINKNATGPLIGVYDTDGVATSGTIDARIQGVKG